MPVNESPSSASNIASFGSNADNPAAAINYSVPVPGAYSFRRVTPLDVPGDWFNKGTISIGSSLTDLGVISVDGDKVTKVDKDRLHQLLKAVFPVRSHLSPGDPVESVTDLVSTSAMQHAEPDASWQETSSDARRRRAAESSVARAALRDRFVSQLAERQGEAAGELVSTEGVSTMSWPVQGVGNSVVMVPWRLPPLARPRIAIVETWQVSAFLGDYGLGRTLQTLSLLPGERTTISIETWRTDTTTLTESSSIFDSSDTAAQERFTKQLSQQSGAAFQDQTGFATSCTISTSASGSFFDIFDGSASSSGTLSASYQQSRQQFATNASQAAAEHANQVNTSRQQAVSATSSSQQQSGYSNTTVREISNTNLRRVLNFVFRELNQTYDVFVTLRDVRVAFYNGKFGSLEIVPLAELPRFLAKHVQAEHSDDVALSILNFVAQCIDHKGTPWTMLQIGTRNGSTFDWADVTFDGDGCVKVDGSPLDSKHCWRIKPGPIGQDGESARVEGVVTEKMEMVLRTDNIVAEALLGQADALDPYASALQALDIRARQADIDWREADIRRLIDALKLVDGQPTDQKVAAWEKVLGEKPEIEVVPVVSVSDGDKPVR